MKTIKASEKFSEKDTETLNMVARMLLNINETKVAEKITAMAKNGWTVLPLFNNVRGRREMICVNRQLAETVLQDGYFNYTGNDKFKFVTEQERKKPLFAIAKALRETRTELNLTQAQVAGRLNVSTAYISAIEKASRKLSLIQANRIATLYGMEVHVTIKRKDNSPLLDDEQK